MSVKAQILDFLLKNQESSFTLQELSTRLGKDKSNLAKVVRKLVSNKEIGYVQGKGGRPSIISYLKTSKIPQDTTSIPQDNHKIPQDTTSIPQAPIKKASKPIVRRKTHSRTLIPSFNQFMEKAENSNSYSAKHLQEKLFVKGKHRAINKERVIRVIRDVLDIIKE